MSTGDRTIDELIGVYNADGGVIGELRYVAGKLAGRAHCALCDITHGRLTKRPEWTQACARLTPPFELVHLNERDADVRQTTEGAVPCVLARVGDELLILLGPEELAACAADVAEFERRLHTAATGRGLRLER